MSKLRIPEHEYTVPDGPKCYSWADDDGGWQKVKCKYYSQSIDRISDREAQSCGLGYSGGIIDHHTCTLFRTGLASEIGVGVFKCNECLEAIKGVGDGTT